MKVIFFTEAGNEFGYGHIMRCYAVYLKFIQNGINPSLYINGENSFNDLLNGNSYIKFSWNYLSTILRILGSIDIAIIDSYIATSRMINRIKEKSKITVCFDDTQKQIYPPDVIVINGALGAEYLEYKNKSLLGIKYFPLRDDFISYRNSYYLNNTINNILITIGGSDSNHLSIKIVKFLQNKFPNKIFFVILGPGFNRLNEFKSPVFKDVILYNNLFSTRLIEAFLKADLIITAGGQTIYELAYLGIPTIAIIESENQANNVENWQLHGGVENAGYSNDINLFNTLYSKIENMMNHKIRMTKSMCMKKIMVGNGAENIFNELNKLNEINC